MVKVRNKIRKRAILLTLACFLLAIPIITLSILVYSTSMQSENRITELGKLKRLDGLDYSIQMGFKKVFELTSGISLYTNTTRVVIITENLAAPRRDIGEIAFNPANYVSFLETKYPNQVGVRDYVLQKMSNQLPLVIMPFDSVYKHDPANSQIIFNPEKITDIFNCTGGVYQTYPNCRIAGSQSLWPISYEINITAPTENGAVIEAVSGCSSGDNCINIRINVVYNGAQQTSSTYAVFPSLTTPTNIDFQGKDNAIKVTISSPARLVVEETNQNTVVDKVSIGVRYADFKENKEDIKVFLPDNLLFIEMEDIGIAKASTARID